MNPVRTIIKLDTGKHYVVSTVRLSFDHSFGHGTPRLFETMVFESDGEDVSDWVDLHCERYATEDEAREGHEKVVEKWRSGQEEV